MVILVFASLLPEPEEQRTRALADGARVVERHVVDPQRDACDGGSLLLVQAHEVQIGNERQQVVGRAPVGHQRESRIQDREHCAGDRLKLISEYHVIVSFHVM